MSTPIGKYSAHTLLAKTALSEVYLAYDPDLELDVAIKRLLDGRRFTNEAKMLGKLRHVPVVDILFQDRDDAKRDYLVMAYLPNGSLADERKQEGRLSPWAIRPILERITQALNAAHQLGFAHCDIKPSNILFDHQWEAFVGDFGMATRIGEVGKSGTPEYMAPEQWRKEPVGTYTDTYQCGVMLFQLLLGQLPFEEPYQTAHCDAPIPSIVDLLPNRWDLFFMTALAKEPAARYQSMTQLLAAYDMVLADSAAADFPAPSNISETADTDQEGFVKWWQPVYPVGWLVGWCAGAAILGVFFGRSWPLTIGAGILSGWLLMILLTTINGRMQSKFVWPHLITGLSAFTITVALFLSMLPAFPAFNIGALTGAIALSALSHLERAYWLPTVVSWLICSNLLAIAFLIGA